MVKILQCVAFSVWLLSFSNMHLKFLHVLLWPDSLVIFITENILSHNCITFSLSIVLLKGMFIVSNFWQL